MRFSSSLVALCSMSAVLATPIPQKPSMASSISGMTGGAAALPAAFLSGDPKAISDAMTKMLGGAASFTPGFFSDLGKGVVAAPGTAPAAGVRPPGTK